MNRTARYKIYHGVVVGMQPASYDEERSDSYNFKAEKIEELTERVYERLVHLAVNWLPQTTGETVVVLTDVVDEKRVIPLDEIVTELHDKTRQPSMIQQYKDSKGVVFRCGLFEAMTYREKGIQQTAWKKREVYV